MSWELVAVLGGLTYLSRAMAVVLLPSLPERLREFLDRMPAALFAGLAVHSIVSAGGTLADGPTLAGAAAAALVAPFRSLPVCLIAGIAGYVVWSLAV